MARVEWVAHRLENWAMWKERQGSGGLGFASTAIFSDGPSARGQYNGAVIPVDELDASITDDAVESLKLGYGHLHKTLHLYYLRSLGIRGTAAAMQRAESTIHAQLGQADRLIATWFEERRTRGAAAAASMSVRAQLTSGPSMVVHMAMRELARSRPKPKREKRRQPPAVQTPEREIEGPPRPRRSRPVLRLKKGKTL